MSVFPGVGSFPTHEGPSSGRGPNLGAFIGRGVPENRATGLGAGKEAGGSATPLSGRQHLFQIGFAALLARKLNPAKRYAFLKAGEDNLSFLFEPVLSDNTPILDNNEYMKKMYYSWVVHQAAQRGELETSIQNEGDVDELAARRFWAGRRGTGWKGEGKGGYMQSLDPGAVNDGGYGTGLDSAAAEAEALMKTYMRYIYGQLEMPLEDMSRVASADLINKIGSAAVKQMNKATWSNQVPPTHTFHNPGSFYLPPFDIPDDGVGEAVDIMVRAYFRHYVNDPKVISHTYSPKLNTASPEVQIRHATKVSKSIMAQHKDEQRFEGGLTSEEMALEKDRLTSMYSELNWGDGSFLVKNTNPEAFDLSSVKGKNVTVKKFLEKGPEAGPLRYVKFMDKGLENIFPQFTDKWLAINPKKGLTEMNNVEHYVKDLQRELNRAIILDRNKLSDEIYGSKTPFRKSLPGLKTATSRFLKELTQDAKNQIMNGYNKLLSVPKSQGQYKSKRTGLQKYKTGPVTKLPKFFESKHGGAGPRRGGGGGVRPTPLKSYYKKLLSDIKNKPDEVAKRDWWVRDWKGMQQRLELGRKTIGGMQKAQPYTRIFITKKGERKDIVSEIYSAVMAPFNAMKGGLEMQAHSEKVRALPKEQRGWDMYVPHPLGLLRLRMKTFWFQGKMNFGKNATIAPGRTNASSVGRWMIQIKPKIFYDIKKDIRRTCVEVKRGRGAVAKWIAVMKSNKDLEMGAILNDSTIRSSFAVRQNILLGGSGPTQTMGAFVDTVVPEELAERLAFIVNTAATAWFMGPGMGKIMDLDGMEGGEFKSWALKWDKQATAVQKRTNSEMHRKWANWVEQYVGGGKTGMRPSEAKTWHPPLFLGPFVHSLKYLGYGAKKWSPVGGGYYEMPSMKG